MAPVDERDDGEEGRLQAQELVAGAAESSESTVVRAKRNPEEPSAEEHRAHEITHEP